jgi:hypothetical protein
MRIDRCAGCGEYIDIASDHKPECPTRHKVVHVTPAAERAMAAILASLEELYDGKQTPETTLTQISRISGKYKMEAHK